MSEVFEKQREHQAVIKLTSAAERIAKIVKLRDAIQARSSEIQQAMYQDFRKSVSEVNLTEIFTAVAEANHTIKHLKKWMKPVSVSVPAGLLGTQNEIRYEPKGVALIISPWNYPFSLMINPLISAIAAGNCAILKPSELTRHTSALLKSFVEELFDENEIALFEGDAAVTQELLKLPFDHIFFTGSTRVGKIVMEAASKHLASVTLELGGKSPVIIDDSADLGESAQRIIWGKFVNGGQTCVAPDYVLVPEGKAGAFVAQAKKAIEQMYGLTEDARRQSPDLCRIINAGNYARLRKLLDGTVQQGAKVEIGGVFNDGENYIAPTILTGVTASSPIMSEEIFGPILPVLTYKKIEETYSFIRAREKPLALYVFSRDSDRTEQVLRNTTAGGTCVNNALIHLANPNLPFGGTGPSGLGNYHGLFGFKAFSHERAVLRQGGFNAFKMMYPPYGTKRAERMIKIALKYLT